MIELLGQLVATILVIAVAATVIACAIAVLRIFAIAKDVRTLTVVVRRYVINLETNNELGGTHGHTEEGRDVPNHSTGEHADLRQP